MKRFITLLSLVILLAGCLCIPVSAESAASSVNLMCTVTSEGDCLATMTVNLRLEEAIDKLYFPLPLNAKGITLRYIIFAVADNGGQFQRRSRQKTGKDGRDGLILNRVEPCWPR